MTRFIRFDNLWADEIDYMKVMLRGNQRDHINEIDEIISCLFTNVPNFLLFSIKTK